MPCPAAYRLPGQSRTGAVYTTDPLYGLFSDSTSQDTAPYPLLCNADVHNYRHSKAWMLHSTYVRWGSHIPGWPLWMFSLTAAFPLLHSISTLCSDVRCTCGYFLPIQIRPFPHNRNGSTAPLSTAGFLFPENVRKVSCRRSPSGISWSQLWIFFHTYMIPWYQKFRNKISNIFSLYNAEYSFL